MNTIRVVAQLVFRRSHEEAGATAIEYALLVSLIAAVIFAAVVILGGSVFSAFDGMNSAF